MEKIIVRLLSSDLKNLLFEILTNNDCDLYFNNI